MDPRTRWLTIAGSLTGILVGVALFLPVEYVSLKPGPLFDVLGEIDEEPVLEVEGAPTYPTSGRLDMTTVSETGAVGGSLYLGSALWAWLHPDQSVEPLRSRYGEDVDFDQQRDQDRAVFDASSSVALAAAAGQLDRPIEVEIVVSSVGPESPADGLLEVGDAIVSVDGQPVDAAADVSGQLAGVTPGDPVRLVVIREGSERDVVTPTTDRPDGAPGAFLGILLAESYTSDFTADVALDGIGGPSAGLVFATAIVDKMTQDDLTAGRHVAGSGTIDAEGRVGPVGGIDKKMIAAADGGAELFLLPRANCREAEGNIPDGLPTAAVETLDQAVDVLRAWGSAEGSGEGSGEVDLPGCG